MVCFSVNENFVCVMLIVMVLLVYVILMVFCYRVDCYDVRKGGIFYFRDNVFIDK